jgi:hypothetical protein
MDFTSTSTDWIYAYKSGSSLAADSASASISFHDNYGTFNLNLATATGGNGTVNPFSDSVNAASKTGLSGSANSNDTINSDGKAGPVSGSSSAIADETIIMTATTAHGFLGAAAFILLFPSGSILLRILHFPNIIWVHVGIQIFGYIVALVVMETGVWIAVNNGEV